MHDQFCAIHLGASSLEASVVTTQGKVLISSGSLIDPTVRREQTYDQLLALLIQTFQQLNNSKALETLVLTTPIPIDAARGFVSLAPAMRGMQDRPLRDDLAQELSNLMGREIKVIVWNDANAAAVRSKSFGHAANFDQVVHLRISTGLGGCILLDDEVYLGRNAMAGEIGHMVLQPFGIRCGCGNIGCAETVIGGQALVAALKSHQPNRTISHFTEIVRAVEAGEESACSVMKNMGLYLGLLICSVANVLNPDAITLSGPIFDQTGVLFANAKNEFNRRVCIGLECPVLLDDFNSEGHAISSLAVFKREIDAT